MNNQDKAKFAELMTAMGETFQKEVTKIQMKIYWNVLENYSIEDVEKAVFYICGTRTITGTLPLPAEIIQAISGNPDEKAELAWRILVKTIENHGYYDSVQFEDPAIGEAVRALGGWLRISGGDDPDWFDDQMQWRRKEFMNLYKNFSRQKCESPVLIGYHEAHNTGKHDKYIPKLVFVGNKGDIVLIENQQQVNYGEPDIVLQIVKNFEIEEGENDLRRD